MQVFAQQHAEIGRDKGRLRVAFGKIYPAIRSVYVKNEFKRGFLRVYIEDGFFPPRLHDFADFAAAQGGVEFFCAQTERKRVLRHDLLLRLFMPMITQKIKIVKKIAFLLSADMIK